MTSLGAVSGRRASIDIVIQLVGRILNLGLGLVVTVLVVRELGDEGYGQWATVFALSTLGTQFSEFGIERIAVRMSAGDPEREREWLGALVTLRFLLTIPVAIAVAAVVMLIAETDEMRVVGLIAASGIVLGTPTALAVAFQLRVRNRVNIAFQTLNSLLWGGAAIVVAIEDAGMVAFAFGIVGASLITGWIQGMYAFRVANVKLSGATKLWGQLARTALPVGIATVITLAYARIDQVIVFELAGEREAGLYGSSYRLLGSSGFLPQAVMTTLFPILAAAYPVDLPRVRRLVQMAGDHLAMVSVPAFAFTLVVADELVVALFGQEFAESAKSLRILMAAWVFICFGYLSGYMIVVLDMQRKLMVYALVGLVLNVSLNIVLIPPFGFVGAAWVTLATEAAVLSMAMAAVLRRIGMRPAWGRLVRIGGSAAAMGLALWALDLAGAPLLVLVLAAFPLYLGPLLAVRGLEIRELRRLLRREDPTA